jgi:hypothetical protein
MWTSTKTPQQIQAEKDANVFFVEDTSDQRISKIIARKIHVNRQY